MLEPEAERWSCMSVEGVLTTIAGSTYERKCESPLSTGGFRLMVNNMSCSSSTAADDSLSVPDVTSDRPDLVILTANSCSSVDSRFV